MAGSRDVSSITSLIGMPVLSLATGNKLGPVREVLIDPVNGVLLGLLMDVGGLDWESIYSFGRDAIMVESELAVLPPESPPLARGRNAKSLLGTRIVIESGEVLGRITNVFVTLQPPPVSIYGYRRSLMDWLLGREFFIPASTGYALSDDTERLVVPATATDLISSDLNDLAVRTMAVRTYAPEAERPIYVDDGDETVVRIHDDDETVVRIRDEDETVVRRPLTDSEPGRT